MYTPQDDHDLYFYEEDYPTEYIFYDSVNKQSGINLVDNTVYAKYLNKQRAIDFLKGIFGNKVIEENDKLVCNMKGILDKKDYILVLERTIEPMATYLDNSGYGIVH